MAGQASWIKGMLPYLANKETMISEWNMAIGWNPGDPNFQPAYIVEATCGFEANGLTIGAYYHIRDYVCETPDFASWFSDNGRLMTGGWCAGCAHYHGMWDNTSEARMRPSFYAFRWLSTMVGKRLGITGATAQAKCLAVKTNNGDLSILIWNWKQWEAAATTYNVTIRLSQTQSGTFKLISLNSATVDTSIVRYGNVSELASNPISFTLDKYRVYRIAVSKQSAASAPRRHQRSEAHPLVNRNGSLCILPSFSGAGEIVLVNAQGRTALRRAIPQAASIDLRDVLLPPGLYQAEITAERRNISAPVVIW